MADITILVSDQKVVGGEWEIEVSARGDTTILGEPSPAQCLAENMMRYAEKELGQEDATP